MCRFTGFGGDRHGSGVARFLVFYCEVGFFFLLFFFMHFCSDGILVGSGQWWRGGHGGGFTFGVCNGGYYYICYFMGLLKMVYIYGGRNS